MLRTVLASLLLLACGSGCVLFADHTYEPRFHNPFPQLSRVAVLPFYNQSTDPTVNQTEFALAYASELQNIPGFEVMPVGVVEQTLAAHKIKIDGATDFQKLAQKLGVDAVVVGSITDFNEYYPPRLGMAVSWYAANPGFHPIPPGYGLPWGTTEEEFIPNDMVREAEFALAREQLKTQTPDYEGANPEAKKTREKKTAQGSKVMPASSEQPLKSTGGAANQPAAIAGAEPVGTGLPADWPDPRGFIPPAPCDIRPALFPQSSPVMEQVRHYDGHDADFTQKLASYYYFRDDARYGGWQSYLQRKSDFIRFCCYLHMTEMLAARGGSGETRVVRRWPIGRYEAR